MERQRPWSRHREEEWWTWLTRGRVLLRRLADQMPTEMERDACKETAEKLGQIADAVSPPEA